MVACRHQRQRTELGLIKPTPYPPHRHCRRWLQRKRRYHYRPEALGVGYEDFDVLLPSRLPKPPAPATPERDEPTSENVRQPEAEQTSPWTFAVLCGVALFLAWSDFSGVWNILSSD